jgi:anaerobic magnesium-protoporphyrin IX monomethyl ester cyclase
LKVLLINCPPHRATRSFRHNPLVEEYFRVLRDKGPKMGDQRHEANNGLLSLAAVLRASGKEVDYLDLNVLEYRKFQQTKTYFCEKEIRDLVDDALDGVSCVLISPLTIGFPVMLRIGRHVKENHPGVPVATGGIFATLNPEEMLRHGDCFDLAVLGEGEDIINDVVDGLTGAAPVDFAVMPGLVCRDPATGEMVINPGQNVVRDLNTVPFPAYDLMLGENPVYRIFTARGCPYTCTFCSPAFMSGYRLRELRPERVLEQIRLVKDHHGAPDFVFGDLTFFSQPDHSRAILEGMIAGGLTMPFWCQTRFDRLGEDDINLLRRAGCTQIALGIESFNQEVLDGVRKGIDVHDIVRTLSLLCDHGIEVQCYFVVGLPGESRETILHTVEFMADAIRQGLIHRPHIGVYVPFPGLPVPEDVTLGESGADAYTSGVFLDLPPAPVAATGHLTRCEVYALWEHALSVASSVMSEGAQPQRDALPGTRGRANGGNGSSVLLQALSEVRSSRRRSGTLRELYSSGEG